MSDICPTVRIKTRKGWADLNESDFDPKVHTLYDGREAAPDGPAELADMTNAELRDLADAEDIDLGDATKKVDLIAAIELGREAAPDEE